MSHNRQAGLYLLLFLVSVPLAACSRGAAPAASASAQQASTAAAPPTGQEASVPTVSGAVLETMNASNYTYVRVKSDKGEVWAASSQFKVSVGDRVTVPLETPMQNFHSPSLNKDFPLIYFASRIVPEGQAVADASTGSPAAPPLAVAHSSQRGAAEAPSAGQSSDAAPAPAGAIPIGKIWADRKALAGKTVTVHGKVVKFNSGILDRNWIHLQDGSGKAADGTNDLLLTTDATARVGDTITATGTVAVDKDFTAGYAYKVMIEKATIK